MNTGFIIINKPAGWTSHDVVAKLRNITGIKKIGHAGTLDPFATGVLILGIGREATRRLDKFLKQDKIYIGKLYLGAFSDTYDKTGAIRRRDDVVSPTDEEIKKVLKKFTGKQKQIPPMYSAKKIGGKKLYELARAGQEIERPAQAINIYKIKLLDYSWPRLTLEIHCSSGTYIRSLAHDLGKALGCGAYLEELKRVRSGEINISQAVDISLLNKNNWRDFLIEIA